VVAHLIEPPLRITLLAQNAAGWAQLCRLVSAAHAVADGTASGPARRSARELDVAARINGNDQRVKGRDIAAGLRSMFGKMLS
jgi:error-prone DNA polymerase